MMIRWTSLWAAPSIRPFERNQLPPLAQPGGRDDRAGVRAGGHLLLRGRLRRRRRGRAHELPVLPGSRRGRAVIIIEADDPVIGLMAFVPVGMSEVSSCMIHPKVSPGYHVGKGEELGYSSTAARLTASSSVPARSPSSPSRRFPSRTTRKRRSCTSARNSPPPTRRPEARPSGSRSKAPLPGAPVHASPPWATGRSSAKDGTGCSRNCSDAAPPAAVPHARPGQGLVAPAPADQRGTATGAGIRCEACEDLFKLG
jgi:hypothetical protein